MSVRSLKHGVGFLTSNHFISSLRRPNWSSTRPDACRIQHVFGFGHASYPGGLFYLLSMSLDSVGCICSDRLTSYRNPPMIPLIIICVIVSSNKAPFFHYDDRFARKLELRRSFALHALHTCFISKHMCRYLNSKK